MFNKDLIIKAIDAIGWSKYKLCKESNLSQSTLSDILTGKNKNPRMDTIQKIASALNVSVDTFFNDDIAELNDDALVNSEKDIKKSLRDILDMLQNSQDRLIFDGEPLDHLTKELLVQNLENSIRMTEKIAKENYKK